MPKVIELLAARGLQLAGPTTSATIRSASPPTLRRAFASRRRRVLAAAASARRPTTTRASARRQALGVPLELHPEAEALIRERMQDIAREQGMPYEPDRPDNMHRLNMGVFPEGRARSSRTRTTRFPASASAHVHFVPGFPVMAWPMIEWVLDHQLRRTCSTRRPYVEKSVIVFGAMEATLTPLMEAIERDHPGVKVFSLPSVDHPQYGRHIELGVKGDAGAASTPAYAQLLTGLSGARRRARPRIGALSACAPNRCDATLHRCGALLDPEAQGSRGGKALKIGDNRRSFCSLCACTSFGTETAFRIPIHDFQQPSNQENLMAAKTVADVMKMVKENEVKFVDFRFTDTRGKEQHVTVPVSAFRRRQVQLAATRSTARRSPAGRASRRRTCC